MLHCTGTPRGPVPGHCLYFYSNWVRFSIIIPHYYAYGFVLYVSVYTIVLFITTSGVRCSKHRYPNSLIKTFNIYSAHAIFGSLQFCMPMHFNIVKPLVCKTGMSIFTNRPRLVGMMLGEALLSFCIPVSIQ